MEDIVLGLLALGIGAIFCFRGFLALRIVIPIWGAFAGFVFGAGLVANIDDSGFLRTLLSWLVGIAFAVVFGLIAYLYYAVAVVIAMGAIGFSLGTSVMVALGVDWSWVVVLVGLTVGVLLAIVAVIGNMPMVLLVVLSAMGGASIMVAGLMLLFGTVDTADFTTEATTDAVELGWWWPATYLVLVIAGLVSQVRATERLFASIREEWEVSSGRAAG